jgi:hypothetical protein
MNQTYPEVFQNPLIRDIITLLILSAVGAFGGYLSAIQSQILASEETRGPSRWKEFHMMQGAAGAIIIVTLAPVDPKIVDDLFVTASTQPVIKFLALALIGGYAGGSLLESSASQYSKRINKIEEKQKSFEEQEKRGLDAIRTAEKILRGLKLSLSEIQAFESALQEISPSARFEIAQRADENRRQHWEKDKEPIERSLLIFRMLVKTDEATSNHWWYASLGYCLKDKINPEYAEAARSLDTAVKIRGTETRSGAYEFNRALCNIKLAAEQPDGSTSQKLEQQIRRDLETARKFSRFEDMIDKDPTVQKW